MIYTVHNDEHQNPTSSEILNAIQELEIPRLVCRKFHFPTAAQRATSLFSWARLILDRPCDGDDCNCCVIVSYETHQKQFCGLMAPHAFLVHPLLIDDRDLLMQTACRIATFHEPLPCLKGGKQPFGKLPLPMLRKGRLVMPDVRVRTAEQSN